MAGAGIVRWMMVAAVALGLAGCGGKATPPEQRAAITDACAERLHDVAGVLLRYYLTHHRLPEKPEELGADVPLVCPVSGKPYVYDLSGFEIPGQEGEIVVYDADRTHAGFRWAIRVTETPDTGALVAKVVALPESRFVGKPGSR